MAAPTIPTSAPSPSTTPTPPAPAPPGGDRRENLGVAALFVAVLALVAAVVGVGFGARALDEDEATGGAPAPSGSAPASVDVALSEFAITPAAIEVAAGGTLEITNEGGIDHDVHVKGTDLASPLIGGGQSASLSLGDLAAGEYTIYCAVAGHEAAGMTATLTVVGTAPPGAAAGGSGAGMDHDMTADEMDEIMAARTKAFPAETKGVGAQVMQPTVTAGGVKQFDVTASEIDWEVEPGKTVKAWAYNGTVPGPTIKVADGDPVRIVLKNELPESTAIHVHGVRLPNNQDGVPDITQAPVKPGQTFTYEFTAHGPAVAMYHSHQNAAKQVTSGLLGTFIVGDLPLPPGVQVSQEIPMVLNDAGNIGFSLNGKSFPATAPVVVPQGQWVLVHYLNEGLQIHPMHLHGLEQLVIAKDGFPLASPYKADTVSVAPGERYSVLVHADLAGAWAWHCHILTHAEKEDGMFGMVTAMVVK